jgi:hypothetical protein
MHPLESSLEALATRVAKLEAQNRRLKKLGSISRAVAAAVVAMGQAPARKVIEANEFVLRDASGMARARLSMETTDRPTLSFYKDKSILTASLAGGDEPFLTMKSAGTAEQVMLGASKVFLGLGLYEKEIRAGLSVQNGTPALDLFSENGKPQVAVSAPSDGPALNMLDVKGKQQVSLNVTKIGPTFDMHDPDSKAGFTLWVASSGGGPDFSMYDSAGKLCVDLVTPQGEPSLKLEDKEGFSAILGSTDLLAPTTGRKDSTSAASITLFGKDKKVLWSAP